MINMKYITLLLVFFFNTTNALVGMPQKVFLPDPCGSVCFSYFQSLELPCSDMVDSEISNSIECLSHSAMYVNSVAWCWELQCKDISKISIKYFNEFWNETFPDSISFPEALALGKPSYVLPDSDTVMERPSLVNDTWFYINYRSNGDFEDQEILHARMGLALVTITWVLVLVGFLYNCYEKFHVDEYLLPKNVRIWFRKNLLYPALFKEKCAVPITLGEGMAIDYVPPRIVSITIFLYYALNIIFCAVGYKGFWDDQPYYHDTTALICVYVGNRAGVLAFANIPILILFASRNNIYQWATGWSYATFQHYHRHVSIICVLETIIHSVCYTIKFVKKPNSAHLYAVEASMPYFWWGIFATVACGLIPGFAFLKFRKYSYEVFLFIHYMLSSLFLVGCSYHITLRFGLGYGYYQWLFCAYAVLGFDFLVRFLRCLWIKFRGCDSKAVIEIVDKESKTMKIVYKMKGSGQTFIGSYYFLYFYTVFPFFTSHPFTVSEWHNKKSIKKIPNTSSDECESMEEKGLINNKTVDVSYNDSTVTFYVQCFKGMTNVLYRKLELNDFKPIEIYSILEGPYGTYERDPFHEHDFIILLTGGIGNTVVINYLNCFFDYKMRRSFKDCHDVKLSILHCDRYKGRLDFLKRKLEEIIPLNAENDVDLQLHNTTSMGRIDIAKYLRDKVSEIEKKYPTGTRRIGIVSCGPGKFTDEIRKECVALQEGIVNDTVVSYITDPFDW